MPSKSKTDVTPLVDLEKSSEAIVTKVLKNNQALFKKLMTMGIVEGTKVKMMARAPLGCPVSIYALGYQLSLRKFEAEQVLVRKLMVS